MKNNFVKAMVLVATLLSSTSAFSQSGKTSNDELKAAYVRIRTAKGHLDRLEADLLRAREKLSLAENVCQPECPGEVAIGVADEMVVVAGSLAVVSRVYHHLFGKGAPQATAFFGGQPQWYTDQQDAFYRRGRSVWYLPFMAFLADLGIRSSLGEKVQLQRQDIQKAQTQVERTQAKVRFAKQNLNDAAAAIGLALANQN